MSRSSIVAAGVCCLLAALPAMEGQSRSRSGSAVAGARPGRARVPATPAVLRSMSLDDRIAQLIVVRAYGDYPRSDNPEYRKLLHWIRDSHVGGLIIANRVRDGSVINAQPFEMGVFINHLQRQSRTPLFIASDFEHGASMRIAQTARFPYLMAFGAAHDPDAMRSLGRITAQEARTIGVSWIFAPDADVNNNPENPIINTRSYGEDPKAVAVGIASYIDGAHSDPGNYVLVTAKHFPGHGDTSEDSHMQLAKLDQSKERIEAVELTPFRAAIDHGVDAIMTAHMAVPAFGSNDEPATVSRSVLTGLLRDELGYKGLIVTDAMDMSGLTSLFAPGEAAVRAIEAGADVLLMPPDPDACIRGLRAAVRSGRITTARINSSAAKILAAKARAGLNRKRFVDLNAISDNLEEKEFDQLAQSVADRAITLVKDEKHLFPMPNAAASCLMIMTEGQYSQRGRTLLNEMRGRAPGMKSYVVNSTMPDSMLNTLLAETSSCQAIYAAAFVTVAAYRGNVGLEGSLANFMNSLLHAPVPVALLSFGNPYLVRNFPGVAAYAATFSTTTTSELAAAKALSGDIAITGKLPVTIPGFAKAGEGLDVAARPKLASNGAK